MKNVSDEKKVTVITINYNLHPDTISCVKSVLDSDYKNLSIHLVDNGSELDDYNQLKEEFKDFTGVRLLRMEENKGYVGGVNFGIRSAEHSGTDYILIMNNDTIIEKSAISELVNACVLYNDKAIVSGKVYDFYHPEILEQTGVIFTDTRYIKTYYPGKNERDMGQWDELAERDSLDDVFWLLPTQVIKDIGYYCDYFFLYAEQGDFAQRARRAGYKLIYTHKAKLWHKGSLTSGGGDKQSPRINYWRGKGMFIFQYRNLKRKYFMQLVAKNMSKYLIKYILSSRKNRQSREALLRGYLAGFLWMFNKIPDSGRNPYLSKS